MQRNQLAKMFILFSLLTILGLSFSFASSITLEQKIGQMIMVGFDGVALQPSDPVVQDILHQRITGVVLFDYNFKTHTFDKNIKSPKQLKSLTLQLQNSAKLSAKQHYFQFYPLLIGIDYEGGRVSRLQSSCGFPKTVSAQYLSEHSLQMAQRYSRLMATVLKKAGINLNFAPVVDLAINPENKIIVQLNRSFSDDPNKVIDYSKVFIQAYKSQRVLCTLKHFPGHGSSKEDTHQGFVDVSKTWQPQEIIPYQKLIESHQNCDVIMTAHVVNTQLDIAQYPASLSYQMTTQLLRKKLGFKGVIITDDLQMKAITDNYDLENTVKLAILAGADILLFGNQLEYQPHIAEEVIKIVKRLIAEGIVSEKRIDLSYNRIIALKKKRLLDH